MFQFRSRQQTFDIAGVKIGGSPGENSTVLIARARDSRARYFFLGFPASDRFFLHLPDLVRLRSLPPTVGMETFFFLGLVLLLLLSFVDFFPLFDGLAFATFSLLILTTFSSKKKPLLVLEVLLCPCHS